tara:strand:- start:9217 stop:10224 length:1008 start_codon:yes stop_codon:yes gene_type:complete
MPWSSWHHRLHKTLARNKSLIPKRASLLLAVSGGQDSMALVQLISDLQRIYEWKLNIWHGDHSWHKNSQKIAGELKLWCKEKDLSFHSDTATQAQTKTESLAREWRYKNLVKRASQLSLDNTNSQCIHILTGHTSSDRAETLLMNLARGSDLTGLTSLRESRVLEGDIQLIRPLLCFSREDTEKICKELDLPIWLDPSNQNLIFSRNKIRHQIMPILETLNKGCSNRISDLAERLSYYQEDQKAIANLAIEAISNAKRQLIRKKLINLPLTARGTVLAKWIENVNGPKLSSRKIAELSQKIGINEPPGIEQLSENWTISWEKEFIEISGPDKNKN